MENNIFIKNIELNDFLHLGNFDIKISDKERKHLIITGKNGCGKTSLLRKLDVIIFQRIPKAIRNTRTESQRKKNVFGKAILNINKNQMNEFLKNNNFIYKYFSDYHKFEPEKSKSIEPVRFQPVSDIKKEFSRDFVKFLFFQDYKLTRSEEKEKQVIINWFNKIKKILCKIYNDENLELQPNVEITDFDFYIKLSNGNRFNFNQLSAGYSSILNIVIELLLRAEICENKYLTQGIVLVDEPEAHLHIELQKEIMPFLIEMFPNIQFIVATHSPFIINSLDNATVFDLEKNIRLEDASAFAYDGLVETYFESDKYSKSIKKKFQVFKNLISKEKISDKEKIELEKLQFYFENIPAYVAPELVVEYQRLMLNSEL